MNKIKIKLVVFLFLSLTGLAAGFFFSGYVNLLLSGGNLDGLAALRPASIMASLAQSERHRMLALCIGAVALSGAAAITLLNRRETFESDTSAVAGSIATPVAIGQGQHGTARWLRAQERGKAYALYRLDESDPCFAALLAAGARNQKEVGGHD
jgi:type IV secretion system protein VirD4